jgi:peptide/nickel transport system permease protein
MMTTGPGQSAAMGVLAPARKAVRRPIWRGVVRFARQKPLGFAGALLLLAIVLAAIFAAQIAPYPPNATHAKARLLGPGARFLLGTDEVSRDLLSRIIYGARISLFVGIVSVGVGTVVGATLGVVSGYFRGLIDQVVQRLMDVVLALPALVLAIAIVAMLGTKIVNVMIAVSIVLIPQAARVVRGATLSVRQDLYVDAARALGASDERIILRHVLPNVVGPIVVLATVTLGAAIITEASLSFLGLGTQPPTASWGQMLSGASRSFFVIDAWLAIVPGLALSATVFSINVLGDALRDTFDPRLRGR